MVFLGLNKHDILVTHKEKLLWVEKLIVSFLVPIGRASALFLYCRGNFLSLPYSFNNYNLLMVKPIH